MALLTIDVCDLCKAQEPSDTPRAWDNKISAITIKCPIDGISGKIEMDLCRTCRVFMNCAIEQAIATKKRGE